MRPAGGGAARQHGQALVMIALMFGALCGMVGLAVDSGRAFVDRRELQNSSDAAAAAGAVYYIRTLDLSGAEQQVLSSYMLNRSLTGASCAPSGWPAPVVGSGGSQTIRCTFSSDASQALTITVNDFAPPASFEEFVATGSQSLLTALVQIVGAANTVPISATGCAATWNSSACAVVPPVVLATSRACGSGTDALTIKSGGGSNPVVVGNLGSYGDVKPNGSPNVAGDTTYYCGGSPSVTSLCYPGGGPLPCTTYPTSTFRTGKPPDYNIPTASGSGTVAVTHGLEVNLSGGTYDSTSANGTGGGSSGGIYFGGSVAPYQNGCYFLSAGVYTLKSVSVFIGGGVFSNELRPPDEPDQTADGTTHTVTMASARQFWNENGANCAGTFTATAVADTAGGLPLPVGAYAFRLTSGRNTDNGGVVRESGPSTCKTLNIAVPTDGVNIAVSNVPGAEYYNVYVSSTALSVALGDGDTQAGTCAGKFYQLASIPVQNYVNETNADTNGCPSTVVTSPPSSVSSTCTLGASAQTDDLCAIDRIEQLLGVISSIPSGCTTLLQSIPDIPPQPPLSCSASGAVAVPPPPGLPNYSVAAACGWPAAQFHELLKPSGGSVLSDQDPAVGYESANWGWCNTLNSSGSWVAPDGGCPNGDGGYTPSEWLTPGAVQLQFDSGGCLDVTGGMPFLFSGYGYAWGVVVHSGTPSCTDELTPAVGGEFVGHYSGENAAVTVAGTSPYVPTYGPQAPTVYGCVIASQPSIDGSNGLAVYFVTPTPTISITGYGFPTGSGC